MILQRCSKDLLAVIEVFRPYEAHDRIDEQRFESSGDRVRAYFASLLVDTVMGIR